MIERVHTDVLERRRALYSDCGTYRYLLEVEFAPPVLFEGHERRPLLPIIGLNPSTATELEDDPTIRREKAFARRWGYRGIRKANLAAFRATDPRAMLAAFDPFGPENTVDELERQLLAPRHGEPCPTCGALVYDPDPCPDHTVQSRQATYLFGLVLACWGAHGAHSRLAAQAAAIVERFGSRLYAFGLTGNRQPKHPLYLPADAPVRPLAELSR